MTPLDATADEFRRKIRVRHLRDLVSHGLYQVDTEALAEKLIAALDLHRRRS